MLIIQGKICREAWPRLEEQYHGGVLHVLHVQKGPGPVERIVPSGQSSQALLTEGFEEQDRGSFYREEACLDLHLARKTLWRC